MWNFCTDLTRNTNKTSNTCNTWASGLRVESGPEVHKYQVDYIQDSGQTYNTENNHISATTSHNKTYKKQPCYSEVQDNLKATSRDCNTRDITGNIPSHPELLLGRECNTRDGARNSGIKRRNSDTRDNSTSYHSEDISCSLSNSSSHSESLLDRECYTRDSAGNSGIKGRESDTRNNTFSTSYHSEDTSCSLESLLDKDCITGDSASNTGIKSRESDIEETTYNSEDITCSLESLLDKISSGQTVSNCKLVTDSYEVNCITYDSSPQYDVYVFYPKGRRNVDNPCHAKTGIIKIFFVIPKEGFMVAAKASLPLV